MTSLRITGLSSGMDVDSMVKTMMKAEQAKRDKLVKQQTSITWKQEAYRDVSTSLVDFRNNKLAKYSTMTTMTAKKAEVTGNTAAVAITSAGSSAAGSMSVTVEKVATAARGVYDTHLTGNDPSMSIIYDTITPSNNKFVVNGKDFTFTSTDTMSTVIARINADKDLNVTAMYADGKLSVSNNQTGDLGSGKNAVLSAPGFTEIVANRVSGQNAAYTVNGLSMTSSTNNVTVNGVGMQLKAETGSNGASVISSTVDADKILNTIKSFITDYNSVLDQVNGKLKEQVYRSYQPLTTEEEEAMSDKQAELWETKAKSGLLSNDSVLASMISNMRTTMVTSYDLGGGKSTSIQSIGITTGKWTDYGKLVIEDEDKLRQAIIDDPESVAKLFTATGSNPSDPTSTDSGIFSKLSSNVLSTLQALTEKAGTSAYSTDKNGAFIASSMLSEQLRSIGTQITDMDAMLKRKEDQYYAQFSAMETAMNKYSSQASAFSSYS